MTYTVFTQFEASFLYSGNMANVLDHVVDLVNEGNTVHLVYCDGKCINTCYHNMTSAKSICSQCIKYKKLLFEKLPQSVHYISFSDYASTLANPSIYPIEFNSIPELKKLDYKGVKIGYAAYSSFLTISRNLFPKFTDEFFNYFHKALVTCCQYTDIVEKVIEDTQPEVVACYNSRFLYARPVVDLANKKGIPHLSYETTYNTKSEQVKITFHSTPHNVEENTEKINEHWNSSKLSLEAKKEIASGFFYKRKNSISSGDKLYVKDQQLGLLPENWNSSKHNILILNSSEDEYAALGDEFESKSLFSSQLEGIKFLIKQFEGKTDFHFYLRVHPNLKNIHYQYHLVLYELFKNLKNFTIIPANSPISTYSLIDNCNKVIVFGSTTGPEAVYWGKPTLLLSYCIYSKLDICYIPLNTQELIDLILDKELTPKDSFGALKYGFFRLNDDYEPMKYYPYHKKNISIFGRHFEVCLFNFSFFKKIKALWIQCKGKREYYKYLTFPKEESI